MKRSAARSKRFCDPRHATARGRARRLWRGDMLAALKSIMGDDNVENEWARERVKMLFADPPQQPAPAPEPEPEMRVTLGDIHLTVSGNGMALLLAPGLVPGKPSDGRP